MQITADTSDQSGKTPAGVAAVRWSLIALCLILLFVTVVRLRLLSMPLERDEGEYAYAGQLMLDGIPPYQLAYNIKLPGTYAAYALIMAVFGQTPSGIHFGFLLANLGAIVLLYFIARRFLNSFGSIMACAAYALLSTSPAVVGFNAHATHLIVLAALAGWLLLLRAREAGGTGTLFCSGFCFGLAFLFKQPGIFFGLMGGAILLRELFNTRPIPWRRNLPGLLCYGAGLTAPFILTCLFLWWAGSFAKFWYWTTTYANAHAVDASPAFARAKFRWFVGQLEFDAVFWWTALVGLVCLLWKKNRNDRKFQLLNLLGFSILTLCPGLHFTNHYFVVMLPVVALLVGTAVETAGELFPVHSNIVRLIPVVLILFLCSGIILEHSAIWFWISPPDVCRELYLGNVFAESPEVGQYLAQHTSPDARIAVLGSEPQLYFYAHRHSASGYIYMYDLMQPQPLSHQMQLDMIHEIEMTRPEYLVTVSVSTSWTMQPGSDQTVLQWMKKYARENYQLEGLLVILEDHYTLRWGDNCRARTPEMTDHNLAVFRRKSP